MTMSVPEKHEARRMEAKEQEIFADCRSQDSSDHGELII